MVRLLYVGRSCVRDQARRSGAVSAGEQLVAAFTAATPAALVVREVACLNGCPQPGNVALRGAGRTTVRFSHIDQSDCAALVEYAHAYWQCAPGADDRVAMPAELRAKLTVCTPAPAAGADVNAVTASARRRRTT